MTTRNRVKRWWEDASVVKHRLAGVFEGGGAKGAAYAGALQATLAKECWFGAVAGASAGAITAALIAAGLNPDEMAAESRAAFERISTGSFWTGLKQLRMNFGFLDNGGIHQWLEEKLAAQARLFGVESVGPVTFAGLYRATGIELNVVAADLSQGRQIVFSVWDTPDAQVGDAVLASSSIPFAFAPRHLLVPQGTAAYVHTLVDGGVWSNFPTFVFKDRSFRRASGRPELVEEEYVVSYLLDEQSGRQLDISQSSFVGLSAPADPAEWHPAEARAPSADSTASRAVRTIGKVITSPFWLPLRFGAWLSLGDDPAWKGRWTTPSGPTGWLMRRMDDGLSALHSAWLAGAALLGVVGGTGAAIYWIWNSFLLLRIEEAYFDFVFREPGVAVEIVQIVLGVLAISLLLTVAVVVLLSVAVNYVMLGPIRQALFGLTKTYAAGPGAPPWAGASELDHVVRLPIPQDLTTLTFDPEKPGVGEAIALAIRDAASIAAIKLDAILASPKIGGPRRPAGPDPASGDSAAITPGSSSGAPAFALRLTVVSVILGAALWFASFVLPTPGWYTYDANVMICADVLSVDDPTCDRPSANAMAAAVTFGPSSKGHLVAATIAVDGQAVGGGEPVLADADGRLLTLPLSWEQLNDCSITIAATVDGTRVFAKTIDLRAGFDVRGWLTSS